MNASDQVVFIVNKRGLDINCAWLVEENHSRKETLVKFKRSTRAARVPSLLCHSTLEDAKAALINHITRTAWQIEGLKYDEENFWVA